MKYILILILSFLFPISLHAQSDYSRVTMDSIGAINAVKKAHQMTDLPILPVRTLYTHKNKTYQAGVQERGLVYSSTKEINTSVGQDVSFHTFMTALHNPRSLLYSERIDKLPYHGKNCRGYYGTVCSGLVTYALGIKITQRSADIPVADYMELVEDQSARGARIADVIWRKGHLMLVTGIEKDQKGQISGIEICESIDSGCRRVYMDEHSFDKMLHNEKRVVRLYRFKDLWKNTSYMPLAEFVAVEGEEQKSFNYNEDICANKGDKSCYVTGEEVVLNVFGGGNKVEIYKDSKLFREIAIHYKDTNVILKNYPYGNYQARVVKGKKKSDYTKWKIIDINVNVDKDNNRICFSSANATPVYYEFCNISGSRPTNKNRVYAAEFTETDIKRGYVRVKPPKQPTKEASGCPYVKVHFECDYGMVINKPVNWFE